MHVASKTLSICQFLVVQVVYTFPIMVGIMDLIRSWIMHSNHIFSSYWVAAWSNSLIFFFPFLFCHYFMYPNNNLHKKLAVSEILNNVSLSLSLFGDPIATSCVHFFFLAGCIMCSNGWRKKNFLQNRNLFYILYSSTWSPWSQNNIFHSIG